MLLTLIKKQFREAMQFLFVNRKNGKARSKASVLGFAALFVLLLLYLCGVFFGMTYLMGESMFALGLDWLYFAIMVFFTILVGIFGSVFNTYSVLYKAKDNEMLLAMPIPPVQILLSRMLLVYGMSLLYCLVPWLPTIVVYWIHGASAAAIVFDVLLLFVLAVFTSVLTCALGWVIALVSSRVRQKNILALLLVVAFLGGYMYLTSKMSSFMESFLVNAAQIGSSIKTWANLLYQMAMAATGDAGRMLLFTGITAVLAAVCIWVMGRSFLSISTRTTGTGKRDSRLKIRSAGFHAALLRRELNRFTSSTIYMMNMGMGLVLLPVMTVVAVIKKPDVAHYLGMMTMMIRGADQMLVLVVTLAVCVVSSMNMISTPSISMEGKNLWILRTLPVSGREVLSAKLELHVLLNLVPTLIGAVGLGYCLDVPVPMLLLCIAVCLAHNWFTGAIGLILGLLRPNFQWTSEVYVVKQSVIVLFAMLAGFVSAIVVGMGGFLLRDVMSAATYLILAAAILIAADAAMVIWLRTKGGRLFERL